MRKTVFEYKKFYILYIKVSSFGPLHANVPQETREYSEELINDIEINMSIVNIVWHFSWTQNNDVKLLGIVFNKYEIGLKILKIWFFNLCLIIIIIRDRV